MTPDDLHAILDKRTPGPWRVPPLMLSIIGTKTTDHIIGHAEAEQDAAAIVAAVNLIGPALAVVEAIEAHLHGTGRLIAVEYALAAFDAALADE